MKKLRWLVEPGTKDRYVRDEWPAEALLPLSRYERIPDYTPITSWGQFVITDPRWDDTLMRRFGGTYAMNALKVPTDPVPISAALKIMGKSYARKHGNTRTIGLPGVFFWAYWHRIPPCWVVVTRSEVAKLLSEEEAGLKH